MNSEEIAKLKKADQLLFDLNKAKDTEQQVKEAGKLLQEAGLLNDDQDLNPKEIIVAYNRNLQTTIEQITGKKKNPVLITFDMTVPAACLQSADQMEASLASDCFRDFKNYAQIVIRFDAQVAAWRKEKSGDDYRQSFGRLDSRRTEIHNACLQDIEVLNRLAQTDEENKRSFFKIEKGKIPDRTDFGNAILKQYYQDLLAHEKAALK